MFTSLLIANRGEIACRVIRTARRMGLWTIAVYSDADRRALHVREVDEAVAIGPAPAKESYLNIQAVIAAARQTGAQAVHPGYGFLSENADFAEACAAAKLVFVGPPVAAIRAMGSKSASKALMAKAQVPLVPGYHGDEQSPERLKQEADKIGYPVLIKASAGGGGKGMKIVNAAQEFAAQLASAQREAQSSFGDAKVLVEKYLARPRHVEIQVFADTHGNFVHLFERDCSIQRRHQKIIEEAPAPGMTEALRRKMGDAAIAAARAISYVGAGTVEFLLAEDGQFYFMEMNTRLQVEHPVSELITGLDLVEWQLRVAAGDKLPFAQKDLTISGHAIEARIYAEDADREFLPQAGRIAHLRFPEDARVDHGVTPGAEISTYYDPMIAKLAVHGKDRAEAVTKLAAALSKTEIAGIVTNVPFLAKLAAEPDFAAGHVDTGFIERHRATLFPARPPAGPDEMLLTALGLLVGGSAASGTWARRDGFRLNAPGRTQIELRGEDGKPIVIDLTHVEGGFRLSDGRPIAARRDGDRLTADIAGRQLAATWLTDHGAITLIRAGVPYIFHIAGEDDASAATGAGDDVLRAPMPGKIAAVLAKEGEAVAQGQPLCVLEAMKMEHILKSPRPATIAAIACAPGQQVKEGAELFRFAEA